MQNLKFVSLAVAEILGGSQNSKVGHVTPSGPFDLILYFLLAPSVANLHAKFEVSSFDRSRDMEGVPKFTDYSLTH